LAGFFALGGIGVGAVVAARRDAAQGHREARKRRAEKLEELVVAIYEYSNWITLVYKKGDDTVHDPVTPFAKIQAIATIYFPQFGDLIEALSDGGSEMLLELRGNRDNEFLSDAAIEAYDLFAQVNKLLLSVLKKYSEEHFQ
jgi:hypothetical protein